MLLQKKNSVERFLAQTFHHAKCIKELILNTLALAVVVGAYVCANSQTPSHECYSCSGDGKPHRTLTPIPMMHLACHLIGNVPQLEDKGGKNVLFCFL